MPVSTVSERAQLIYARGWGPGIIANLDVANPAYISTQGRSVSAASEQLPALGCIVVDGTRDVFATTAADGVSVQVQAIPGTTSWSPSPAQIAAQTQALLQPNLMAAYFEDQSIGGTLYTFTAPGRIWMLDLVEGITTNTSYSGVNREHVTIGTVNLGPLLQIEIVISNVVGQSLSQSKTAPFANPLPVAAGDAVVITASGQTADTTRRIAGSVLYSVP